MNGDFEDSTLASAHRPGRVLQEERIRRKLGLDAVARQLRLSIAQVEALEGDNYEKLPGTTFVRGFIRNYARVLDLDAEPLLARFELMHPPPSTRVLSLTAPKGEVGSSTTRLFPGPKRRLRRARMRMAVSAIVVLVLLLFASGVPTRWARSVSNFADVARTAVAPSSSFSTLSTSTSSLTPVNDAQAQPLAAAPPAAPKPAAPATPASSLARLEFDFAKQSWVEVRDHADHRLMAQLNPAGTRQALIGQPPLSLVVGNASEVTITYNGRRVDLAPYTQVNVARLKLE